MNEDEVYFTKRDISKLQLRVAALEGIVRELTEPMYDKARKEALSIIEKGKHHVDGN